MTTVLDIKKELSDLMIRELKLRECPADHVVELREIEGQVQRLETKKAIIQALAIARGNMDINITFCDNKTNDNIRFPSICGYPVVTADAITYDGEVSVSYTSVECPNCHQNVYYYRKMGL